MTNEILDVLYLSSEMRSELLKQCKLMFCLYCLRACWWRCTCILVLSWLYNNIWNEAWAPRSLSI